MARHTTRVRHAYDLVAAAIAYSTRAEQTGDSYVDDLLASYHREGVTLDQEPGYPLLLTIGERVFQVIVKPARARRRAWK